MVDEHHGAHGQSSQCLGNGSGSPQNLDDGFSEVAQAPTGVLCGEAPMKVAHTNGIGGTSVDLGVHDDDPGGTDDEVVDIGGAGSGQS